ncbi:MAG: hypothetical protein GXO93_03385, partial [FCB group bacterium]|nr:hypothetical protein [FCB group bacterium]
MEIGIKDAIKSRIESLNHTRQLVVVLVTIFTGLYVIGGKDFAAKIAEGQYWHRSPGHFFILLIVGTLVLFDISFILAVFLLTDSIHNYSKVLEYSCEDLFDLSKEKGEPALSHNRALISDDLSYFFVRIGTLLLILNLLITFVAIIFSVNKNAVGTCVLVL